MQLTEIRIQLCGENIGRLKAYCSLTFDGTFVVRDVKLVEGNDGLFLAMPSRKICDRCDRCGDKNHLRARFCNHCGARLDETRYQRYQNTGKERNRLHSDLAHPINPECRASIENQVVAAFKEELRKSASPGYVRTHLDLDEADLYDLPQPTAAGDMGFSPIHAGMQ